MLRVLFAGTPDVAVPSLKALVDDPDHFDVVAVLTRPDAPTGRGRRIVPNPVKTAALELGLPVIESDPSEETFIDELVATGADAAAVVAYGRILKQDVIDALPLGWYNLHFSLLPQWRGAAPVQRAIWAGDSVTGATVFRITAGLDSGPILAQSTVSVGAHETAGELLERLAEDGSRLLVSALQGVADDEIVAVEQPQGAYEVARKITVEDAHIRFDIPAFAVDRQIRACTPHPGAWCELYAQGAPDSKTDADTSAPSESVETATPSESAASSESETSGAVQTAAGVRNADAGTADARTAPAAASAADNASTAAATAEPNEPAAVVGTTPSATTVDGAEAPETTSPSDADAAARTVAPCAATVLHVLRARPADMENPNVPRHLEPGQLCVGKRAVWVGTASEPLELLEVKAQGKKAMAAADWARGARLGDRACCR